MCAGDVLVSCDVSDKWRVEGIVGWTGGRVGACVCEVQHALDGKSSETNENMNRHVRGARM